MYLFRRILNLVAAVRSAFWEDQERRYRKSIDDAKDELRNQCDSVSPTPPDNSPSIESIGKAKEPLLEECPLASEDSLKRHDWKICDTAPMIKSEQGLNGPVKWCSLLRCQRCGKPVKVWE